jgi:excisionase family DNA binding protein
MTTTDNKPQSVSTGITTDNAAMVEPIYTIDEVTQILKLKNTRTVQGWLKAGKMRGFKAGKEWRVTESALNEFINKGGGE